MGPRAGEGAGEKRRLCRGRAPGHPAESLMRHGTVARHWTVREDPSDAVPVGELLKMEATIRRNVRTHPPTTKCHISDAVDSQHDRCENLKLYYSYSCLKPCSKTAERDIALSALSVCCLPPWHRAAIALCIQRGKNSNNSGNANAGRRFGTFSLQRICAF